MQGMTRNIWVIIPAAGNSNRFSGLTPKQHTHIGKYTLLEYSAMPFLASPSIAGITVSIAPTDTLTQTSVYLQSDSRVRLVHGGGQTRTASVLNALLSMADAVHDQDWILIHDAARPCLSNDDLSKLIDAILSDGAIDGAILATPVTDTLKKTAATNNICQTLSRSHVWHALTPQAFRYGSLTKTLKQAISSSSIHFTDESSAMELAGLQPLTIRGSRMNLKVTYPEDIVIAESFLKIMGRFKPNTNGR